jgi:hypothetical protein
VALQGRPGLSVPLVPLVPPALLAPQVHAGQRGLPAFRGPLGLRGQQALWLDAAKRAPTTVRLRRLLR